METTASSWYSMTAGSAVFSVSRRESKMRIRPS